MYEKRNKKSNLPHGSGKKDIETKITLIEYDEDNFNQKIIEKCSEFVNKDSIKWIKINGFSKIENLKEIGQCLNLDTFVLEEILNNNQRPKIESFKDYLYIVLKLIDVDAEDKVNIKQISFILQKNVLISFQNDEDNIFDLTINRLKSKKTQMRTREADYLLFSLIYNIIERYFYSLEMLEDHIGDIEEDLIAQPES